MVVSMTGYGRGEATDRRLAVAVEVKTVNHRHFEALLSLPSGCWELEAKLRQTMQQALLRGRADCSVFLLTPAPGKRQPIIDMDLAARYTAALRAAGEHLRLSGGPDLALIASLPGVVRAEERPECPPRLTALTERALAQALRHVLAMRSAEGRRLAKDIRGRLQAIRGHAAAIKRAALQHHRLQARPAVNGFAARPNGSGETRRPAADPAAANSRADITEEIVRFGSHTAQFVKFLGLNEPVGRRLEFLLQEMHREVNTMGSKAGVAAMVHHVVAIKEELEKIREQVQNVA